VSVFIEILTLKVGFQLSYMDETKKPHLENKELWSFE